MLKSLLRAPLGHFVLCGLAGVVWSGGGGSGAGDERRIELSAAQVEDLARQFEATWRRPPQPAELQGLIDNYVQDEILYREGKALGLLEDDPVIKRRVRQKLDVVAEELLASEPPTEAQLAQFLAEHPDRFRQPPRVSFEQVFFGALQPDAAAERRIAAIRARLERGADPQQFGDPTLLPRRETAMPLDLVARSFGETFATQLETLPVGSWQGPVVSGFGLHLVRLTERVPAELPALGQIRAEVEREWEAERRRRALEENYRRLREQYEVRIDTPAAGSAP